jgi:hypothetical protein
VRYVLIAVALALAWQLAVVERKYDGNWTGLYYTGAQGTVPPQLGSEDVYRFAGRTGYDGQFYHYIAHDPWMHRGIDKYVDNPSLRWRRILLPGLAWLLAFGRDDYVDSVYFALVLAFVGLGSWWTSKLLGPRWALGFLLVPAVLVSLDRMTVDVATAALTVGAMVQPWIALPLAALSRETGFLLIFAVAAAKRDWRYLLCGIPAALWYAYVGTSDQTAWLGFGGIFERTLHPIQYELSSRWLRFAAALDYLALLGIWTAIFLCTLLRRLGVAEWIGILFALFALILGKRDIWSDGYAFGRTLSPLLIALAIISVRDRRPLFALPLLMVLPRILFQLNAALK